MPAPDDCLDVQGAARRALLRLPIAVWWGIITGALEIVEGFLAVQVFGG